uniref:NADH-ubiquinone oxidoreductase chain 6 n=1 Tax=Rhyzodiastes puetzi TaxID=2983424 RepID=A0A977XRU5_9CARA|nr:NADH dehydrogenase subunit 6 [Rhyzodiastes puetzi]UXW64222.1 NADH dehydrogenase subunit 6 [Rhyzodiastes puetzi]
MYSLLLLLNLNLSIIFMFMKHPLSMGLMLFLQTIMISLIMGFFNITFWFSYIMFLIMIGGMLILFIYMTSLASNEKFSFSSFLLIMLSILNLMLIMLYYPKLSYFNMNTFSINSTFLNSLKFIFNLPINFITIMLMIYLLITLIIVIKITNLNQGPLRQKF